MKMSTAHAVTGLILTAIASNLDDLKLSLGTLIFGAVSCGVAVILREMGK